MHKKSEKEDKSASLRHLCALFKDMKFAAENKTPHMGPWDFVNWVRREVRGVYMHTSLYARMYVQVCCGE
jgi:hypothetical protein